MKEIIDFHAHIYPEKISERASQGIADFYDMPVAGRGSSNDLLKCGKEAGVHRFVVQSVATVPSQVRKINSFIAEEVKKHKGTLTGYGTLHPKMSAQDIEQEVEYIISSGLKGIKLHPDFQQFNLDSEEAFQIFEIVGVRLPFLLHAGDHRYGYSHPKRLANALNQFKQLRVAAAHFGGWSQWDDAITYLSSKDILVDSSSSLYAFSPGQGRKLVRKWGAERVLFGTDYPMWTHKEELERFFSLKLTDDENEKILFKNAENLIDK